MEDSVVDRSVTIKRILKKYSKSVNLIDLQTGRGDKRNLKWLIKPIQQKRNTNYI